MSLCLPAAASLSAGTGAASPRERLFARLRGRLSAFSPVEAEGELMPAPTRADVRRVLEAPAISPGRPAFGDDVNALLL